MEVLSSLGKHLNRIDLDYAKARVKDKKGKQRDNKFKYQFHFGYDFCHFVLIYYDVFMFLDPFACKFKFVF